MTGQELVRRLRLRLEEEQTAYRVERENREGEERHAGKASAFAEVLELLGEPFDPIAGKPEFW